jgi:hypothetical protein
VPREHPRAADGAVELLGLVGVGADEAEVALHEGTREVRAVELREHDHGRLGHRPADEHVRDPRDQPLEVGDRLGDRRLGRAVEHEAHRTLLRVLGDEDHRAGEVRVVHRRRGEQELSAQRVHVPLHCGW